MTVLKTSNPAVKAIEETSFMENNKDFLDSLGYANGEFRVIERILLTKLGK